MCGIAGYTIAAGHPGTAGREVLARMIANIAHRGPDGQGILVTDKIGLAHRRLAVIDLTTGDQPMVTREGALQVVFNGEIYNHRFLRRELESHGHQFQTDHSDTEVLLHGYRQWGPRGLCERLNGMFAFALWDTAERRLMLARDRTGEKPLFYAHTARQLAFASEIKALLPLDWWSREIDHAALDQFLTLQYVPHPWTIYRGVRKLPPAHFALWTQETGELHIERYWELDYSRKLSITFDEAVRELEDRVSESVRTRLESDVPLGCFLSGGVDSSAVVAMMRRHVTGDLHTFSIGFKEEEFNELPYARKVAERYATHHEELIVEPDVVDLAPRLAWHFDEPFADPSAFPTFCVSQMTRRHVTVALSGDGGDESFAGYRRYAGFHPLPSWERVPRALRQAVHPLFAAVENLFPNWSKARVAHYVNHLTIMSPEQNYAESMYYLIDADKRAAYTPEMRDGVAREGGGQSIMIEAMHRIQSGLVDRMMGADIATYLPGALLPKVDRTAMAVALEVRAPFLDHTLMEWAASLPMELKYREGELKALLKKTLEPHVPHECLYRRKTGFGVPTAEWLRGPLEPMARDLLLGPELHNRGLFNPEWLRRTLDDHLSRRVDNKRALWALLCFELWARVFIDGGGRNPCAS